MATPHNLSDAFLDMAKIMTKKHMETEQTERREFLSKMMRDPQHTPDYSDQGHMGDAFAYGMGIHKARVVDDNVDLEYVPHAVFYKSPPCEDFARKTEKTTAHSDAIEFVLGEDLVYRMAPWHGHTYYYGWDRARANG